jgi:HicA-like toxin of HicAB toxin-antitoxin system
MPIDRKLLERAYRRPQDLRFAEVLTLAEQLGFERVRIAGSHHIFRHPRGPTVSSFRTQFPQPLNLQEGRAGKAKAYQVKQMLQMAETLGIITPAAEE